MNPNDSNGEDLETPDGSQPEMTTADEGSQVNPQGAQEPNAEEVAFNSLKGSTQDRVRTLAQRANQVSSYEVENERLRQELEALRLKGMTPQPFENPDVRDAVSKLDQFGVATKDYTNKAIDEKVDQKLSGIVWKMEMDRLEGRHTGNDGLPAFDRSEYEAYINANPQYRGYAPEDVYDKMYEDEIFDARVKGLGPKSTKQAPSLRPTRTRVQEETMTPDYIEKRLQQPDGRVWYEQNKDRINAVVAAVPSTE
jgi:hypothetical protein